MKRFFTVIPVILLTGILILSGGFAPSKTAEASAKYRKGVVVCGEDISGLTKRQAEDKIRGKLVAELKQKSLTVNGNGRSYVFCYPEINFASDLSDVLNDALSLNPKKETARDVRVGLYINNLDGIVDRIYRDGYVPPRDAEISFFPSHDEKFKILPEKSGSYIDKLKLKEDILYSLKNGFCAVNAKNIEIKAEITQKQLLKQTFLRSKFYTTYSSSTYERKENIALASKLISGTVLEKGEEFSFNTVVGERTEKRGFKQAKIIMDGKFVDGVGGGVCQLSTTLYNAALTAGLEITEQHRHTLAVGYVSPSFDAMVNSSSSDLKFKNNTDGKIFIKIDADGEKLTVYIYGEANMYEYRRVSVVTGEILPPPAVVIDGEADEVVQWPKNGLTSEGYIEVYKDGILLSKKLIRKDKYKPIGEIRKKGPEIELSDTEVMW